MQFRARALAKRRQADQLDGLLTVARPRGWLALAALGLVVVALVVAAFVVEVPRTITVRAVLDGPDEVTLLLDEDQVSGVFPGMEVDLVLATPPRPVVGIVTEVSPRPLGRVRREALASRTGVAEASEAGPLFVARARLTSGAPAPVGSLARGDVVQTDRKLVDLVLGR